MDDQGTNITKTTRWSSPFSDEALGKIITRLHHLDENVAKMSQTLDAQGETNEELSDDRELFKYTLSRFSARHDAVMQPLWDALASFPHPRLQSLARKRPRHMRRGPDGRAFLRYALTALRCEATAEVLAFAIEQKALSWELAVDGEHWDAVGMWAQAHPGQLRRQLKREGVNPFLRSAAHWVEQQEAKEILHDAGTVIDDIENVGQLRLMDSTHLPALGRYLECCIGDEGMDYISRADTKASAFVCMYDPSTKMPFGVAELVSVTDQVRCVRVDVSEVQSRCERGGWWESSLTTWVQHKQAVGRLQDVMQINPSDSLTLVLELGCDTSGWWDSLRPDEHISPFGTSIAVDAGPVIAGLRNSYTDLKQAACYVEDYLGWDAARDFEHQICDGAEREMEGEELEAFLNSLPSGFSS